MAGFTSFISVLSAVMLYVQQKTSDYLVILNLKTPPFFKNVLTLGTPPPPPVTKYVTKILLNTETATAVPWSTVTSATTVYVTTPLPSAAYTAIVSGQNNNSHYIVTSNSPWQTWHLLVLLFVLLWVPLCFAFTQVNQYSRIYRRYNYNQQARELTEEYFRQMRELEMRYRPRGSPLFFELMYAETYVFLLRCHHKVDPYLQAVHDTLTAAGGKILDKAYTVGRVVLTHLIKALTKVSRVVFEQLCRLLCQVLWLLYNLLLFVVLPASKEMWSFVKIAVATPIQEQAVKPLTASIKKSTLQHISNVKETLASSPLLKRAALHNANVSPATPTPVQPNHFEVPYSDDSPRGMILVDGCYYEELRTAAGQVARLQKELARAKQAEKDERRECGEICGMARERREEAEAQARSARDELRAVKVSKANLVLAEMRAARAEAALQQEQTSRETAEEDCRARQACLDQSLEAYNSLGAELQQMVAKNGELERKVSDLQAAALDAAMPAPVAPAPATQPAPQAPDHENEVGQFDLPELVTESFEEFDQVQNQYQPGVPVEVPMGPEDLAEVLPGGFEDLLESLEFDLPPLAEGLEEPFVLDQQLIEMAATSFSDVGHQQQQQQQDSPMAEGPWYEEEGEDLNLDLPQEMDFEAEEVAVVGGRDSPDSQMDDVQLSSPGTAGLVEPRPLIPGLTLLQEETAGSGTDGQNQVPRSAPQSSAHRWKTRTQTPLTLPIFETPR